MRITDYMATGKMSKEDLILLDNLETGTRTISGANLASSIGKLLGGTGELIEGDTPSSTGDLYEMLDDMGAPSALRRQIYRGKNLGWEVTRDQWNEIGTGAFHNMFVGDYWIIDGIRWKIADFDYWLTAGLATGDWAVTTHHLVIIPDQLIGTSKWNGSNSTSTGYAGSGLRISGLTASKEKIRNAFGADNILARKDIVPNKYPASAYVVIDSDVDVPTSVMIYGHVGLLQNGDYYKMSANKVQLALFSTSPWDIGYGHEYWLRDPGGTAAALCVDANGMPDLTTPATEFGVLPVFGICKGETV